MTLKTAKQWRNPRGRGVKENIVRRTIVFLSLLALSSTPVVGQERSILLRASEAGTTFQASSQPEEMERSTTRILLGTGVVILGLFAWPTGEACEVRGSRELQSNCERERVLQRIVSTSFLVGGAGLMTWRSDTPVSNASLGVGVQPMDGGVAVKSAIRW